MISSYQKYKLVQSYWSKAERIPEDWQHQKLKSFINIFSGYPFESQLFDSDEGIPLIRIRDLPNKNTETFYSGHFDKIYVVSNGDLLVGMDGEFKPYLWKGSDALLNQRVCKITTKDDNRLDQLFLYYAIGRGLTFYQLINSGTTVGHISKFDIENIKVYLPPPQEQKKIATILSKVDELIQKIDQIIEQTQKLKKGLMQKLLTKGIGHTKFKKTQLGEVPVEWNLKKLVETSVNGIRNGIFKKRDDYGSGVPLVNVSDLFSDNDISIDKLERVKVNTGELRQFQVEEGDIFFCRSSLVADGIGRSNIVSYLPEPAVFECHVMMIRPDKKIVIPKYLSYYIHSSLAKKFLYSIAMTLTMTTIRQPDLERLPILLPSIREQERIATILSEIDKVIKRQKTLRSNYESLKKGLMQKLLTGKIRVKV